MKRFLCLALVFTVIISSCKKGDTYDAAKQAAIDEQVIKDFIASNNIQGAVRHQSGVYYVISNPGTGSTTYSANTYVTTKYTGRLLNGQIFDSNTTGLNFRLGGVIAGWQIGIPLIQKGGKIRLLIPSTLAYGPDGYGAIPKNAVLDFDVELINVQ